MFLPSKVRTEFPEPLQFLFERWRYKSLQSGRGAGKSWSVADALLMLGVNATIHGWRADRQPLRIVCARETQSSIKDSVHKLLGDRIKDMGLRRFYEVQRTTILGKNGTEFIFTGLSDPESMKSLEGADILWVEEAQKLSKHSWEIIRPTVRREGKDANGPWTSEIWATWNPGLDTEETYLQFCVNPPTGAKCVTLNWRDNPWFPKVLDIERLDLLAKDPVSYRNILGRRNPLRGRRRRVRPRDPAGHE
jgi:phage terminase large subunit